MSRIGPYEIVRLLGRGGMGEVWEALLHGPGGFRKPVALKVLRPDRIADVRVLARLQSEARLGARLSHPNVVAGLHMALARCDLDEGAPDAAEAHLEAAEAHRAILGAAHRAELGRLRGELALARGDVDEARARLVALEEQALTGHALVAREVEALRACLA